MSWTPLAKRFADLPLILSGPLLRRVERESVTVWLALKEPCTVTLRVYARNEAGELVEQCEGTRQSIRLGDRLHIVAVTAHTGAEALQWGGLYYYNLFFQTGDVGVHADTPVPATAAHLGTPGVLIADLAGADDLHRLVYPGQPLPSFMLPPEDINLLRIVHGSCRKPHGVGSEMLSALDTLLESAVRQGRQRPQQLFLTGDQIYADDVATPLLFALIDAGGFLLAGNREEVLPGVDVPACDLAPGTRGDIIRYRALFTTTTPQNQLMALAEYAAMYLFAWSDIAWPADLPGIEELWDAYPKTRPHRDDQEQARDEYAAQLEQLAGFRSTLPQVRRALANIATYTICDDHEITDDWFLDGLWCQRVLAGPLGRRIIRNGLLAYALFQGWGNTPYQFAEPNGAALLDAVDTWRGDVQDAREQLIEELIGLPAAFDGTGTLPRSPRALHWYHHYQGPRYQVIVMDTRTQRIYHSPQDVPGLLSPAAMQAQIAGVAREDAEVTIMISATPVLGVDFIESIQVWSHWIAKDNYGYDCEAWALEWETFQHFLKLVSAMKRVVFLSGDVHYSFGSSMEYWDQHTHASAKLVDFTSSPFRNEDAGAHMVLLAIGYPRLLHLLRRQGTPTLDFFAWDISPGDARVLNNVLSLIQQRMYLFWWAIPRLLAARRSPYEIVLPAKGWLKGAFHDNPPDRVYRLRYLRNTLALIRLRKRDRLRLRTSSWVLRLLRLALAVVTFIDSRVRSAIRRLAVRIRRVEQSPGEHHLPERVLAHEAVHGTNLIERQLAKPRNRLVAALKQSVAWMNRMKAGELIIGFNNLGEIHFAWTAEKKSVIQRIWYRSDDTGQSLLKTDYSETLDLPAPHAAPPLP